MKVTFLEFYRQWPGYFTDSFNAAYAGALKQEGHDVAIKRFFLHQNQDAVLAQGMESLADDAPADVLVIDRVWDRTLLIRALEASRARHVVVLQWESPARWPEVTARISPISRDTLSAYIGALGRDEDPATQELPNLYTRNEDGTWKAPSQQIPLEIKREFRSPLNLAHEQAQHFGLEASEYGTTRYLILNMGCPYRTSQNTTGFLDDLDLPTTWGASGCTFCNVGPYERQNRTERRALMDAQLASLAPHGPYTRLVVQDEYIFRDLDTLVDAVKTHANPGVDIMVRARVDYIDSCRDTLLKALESLGDFGTITPYLVGFENFSDAELARYNKGQTRAESIAAAKALFELSETYENLTLSPSQGFILFGPWTTLDDLHQNVLAFKELGFSRLRGSLTRSKLRLNPDAALVAKAKADGLLINAYEGANQDNAQETGYQAEIPYRFADAQTARIWELLNGDRQIQGSDEIDRLARAIDHVRKEARA